MGYLVLQKLFIYVMLELVKKFVWWVGGVCKLVLVFSLAKAEQQLFW